MQIRRFFAKDMRNALAEVSRELGPDAAILSSRRIGDGVELLAAIDYDPSVLSTVTPRSAESTPAAGSAAPVAAKRTTPASSQSGNKKTPFEAFLELAESQQTRAAGEGEMVTPSAPPRERSRAELHGEQNGNERIGKARNRSDHGGDDSRRFSRPPVAATKAVAGKRTGRFGADNGPTTTTSTAAGATAQDHVLGNVDQQRFHPGSAENNSGASGQGRAGINTDERQALQADWPRDGAAPAGLRDLQEGVRQLRGLMQEQLQGLAWRDLKQRQPLRAMLTKRLAALELSPRLRELYASAEGRDVEQALATAYAAIARDIVNSDDAMLDQGGIYAFVGATGVGKTTTIAKLAARFALRHGAGSVALISTDSFRIAGHDQLATYARLIGCAIRTADSAASLQSALDSFVDRRLILIDTAGMSQRDARLAEQLAALASARYPVKQVLVLSATAQRAILQESVKQFGQRRVHGAILTKLDETTSLGAVLTVLLESRLPLMASCDGQRVPEDLRSLRGAQLVDRALKLAEQFRDGPDEWLVAQELLVSRGVGNPTKVTAHAGI